MQNKRKWTVILSAAVLVLISLASYLSITAEYGDKEDPLVTLSYVNEVLTPQTMEKFNAEIDAKKTEFSQELDAKIKEASDKIEVLISAYGTESQTGELNENLVSMIADEVIKKMGAAQGGTDSGWTLLKLNAGQSVTCGIGCEIVLRLGSATCVSSGTTGPIDLSDATVLAPDKGYAENHLYLVTIEGRGLKAGSNGCTILIKGDYKQA